MLYCQSESLEHRAPAAYALTFARSCGHLSPAQLLACHEHGAMWRRRPREEEASTCQRCGIDGVLTLVRIEDVFEKQVGVPLPRTVMEQSPLSPITMAYDRAYALAQERGLEPVTAYRLPVRWADGGAGGSGADVLQAQVTLAVTLPYTGVLRTG